MSQLTELFFRKILSAEGGYQNHPADTGNYNRCALNAGTKYGITPNAWQEYSGQACPDAATMQALTEAQAWSFMDWWGKRWRIWEIADQQIAELVFNAFYGNPTAAARTLQQTLTQRGFRLTVDAVMGSKTLAAVNVAAAADQAGLYNDYRHEWIRYLQSLGNPLYESGWINRMNLYFPPLPDKPADAPPQTSPNYQVELWQRRFAGVFKSREDALWVFAALTACFALIAFLYYRLKTFTA